MEGPYSGTAVRRAGDESPLRLFLLDHFDLVGAGGGHVHLAAAEERLLAFLALHERDVPRAVVGGRLWPDVPEARSSGSLRSTLWRVGLVAPDLVASRDGCLGLRPGVIVDLWDLTGEIDSLLGGAEIPGPKILIGRLASDVLPDWDEDWIVLFREHWRQLRLHALDALARQLLVRGSWADAAEAGLTALGADPLRETAHEVLIRTYLAEGNRPEALRQYRAYVALLRDELNLEPSSRLRSLVEDGMKGA